ncbi:MAG: general secretion pathway protein GspB [Planctomycetota bacterium]|jgi:hypothetical protein|nr:general secretion pathway protein GspB [Planctomycetota bacterium]
MKRSALGALLFCSLFARTWTGAAWGGQGKEAPKAETQFDKMSMEEIRGYQRYYFASGGRDPMIMRLPTNTELGLNMSPVKLAPTLEQIDTFLSDAIHGVSEALMNRKYEDALKKSNEAIYKIENEWPPIKAEMFKQIRMVEELNNYNRMAVALKKREDVAIEFKTINIRVGGIVWSPFDARAVVNNRLLAAGDIMLAERKEGDLRVEMIGEREVVFQFKNIRFRLPVEMFSPDSAVGVDSRAMRGG